MFEKSALLEETKKVRGLLDKKQYPETYAALSEVLDQCKIVGVSHEV